MSVALAWVLAIYLRWGAEVVRIPFATETACAEAARAADADMAARGEEDWQVTCCPSDDLDCTRRDGPA